MADKAIDIQLLARNIEEYFPEIAFACIFGSAQDGIVRQGSDIDIAIYYLGSDLFISIEVEKQLEKAFGTQFPIDVTELQKTENMLLAFEALCGKLLFLRDEAIENYADFYTRICRLHEDKMYWMKKQLEYRGYEVQWDY